MTPEPELPEGSPPTSPATRAASTRRHTLSSPKSAGPTVSSCIEPGCSRPKRRGVHRCGWHWLARQPIEIQVEAAQNRRAHAEAQPGYEYRARVPRTLWVEGRRWCSGCQSMVPLDYTRGSRCVACASQASHASHVSRTYDLDPQEYDRLLEWQQGRCFVCGQRPRSLRLAVDHDHDTGAVRGLLCASDQWGCNVSLRRILGDVGAARRLVEYVELSPLERMRAGEPPRIFERRPSLRS